MLSRIIDYTQMVVAYLVSWISFRLRIKKNYTSWVYYFVMFDRLFLTSMSAYRGGFNVLDYGMSGAVVGSVVRFRLGPPAMAVGGVLGKSWLWCSQLK